MIKTPVEALEWCIKNEFLDSLISCKEAYKTESFILAQKFALLAKERGIPINTLTLRLWLNAKETE